MTPEASSMLMLRSFASALQLECVHFLQLCAEITGSGVLLLSLLLPLRMEAGFSCPSLTFLAFLYFYLYSLGRISWSCSWCL